MKKKVFILLIFLMSKGKLFAQLNESDTIKFQLRASVTGNYQQGNVEVLNIKSKIEFSFSLVESWVVKSQNSSLYQAFYSVEANNDIFSRNYIYYKPQRKIYPFAIAYISSNFRRKIDNRSFFGTGITWQVFNKKNMCLNCLQASCMNRPVLKKVGIMLPYIMEIKELIAGGELYIPEAGAIY